MASLDSMLSQQLSGPHFIRILKHPETNCSIVLIGEEHSNRLQCQSGADVVDVLKQCVRAGCHLYVEMAPRFEKQDSSSMKCTARPVDTVRNDVLNELRTCLMVMRADPEVANRIVFTDIRDCTGQLPYSAEENDYVSEVCDVYNNGELERARQMIVQRFIPPMEAMYDGCVVPDPKFRHLLNSNCCPQDRFIVELWNTLVRKPLVQAQQHLLTPDFVHEVVDLYRLSMDSCMEIYTAYRMTLDMRAHCDSEQNCFVFYAGSAHSVAVSDLFRSRGFGRVSCGMETVACVKAKPQRP